MSINVKKRNGRGTESLNLEKMHVMVEQACEGLAGVSASQVEINSGIQFYDGITTAEIQEILIRSASDLIDLDHPNYQFVAARLLLFSLRKQIYRRIHEAPTVKDHVQKCVDKGVYDSELLDLYSDEEYNKLQSFIDHDRDYLFTYAGLRQVVDKYLVQDRSDGALYETPQFMYLLIAATIFSKYPIETRLDYVRRYYDAISKHRLNIPTPIMAGVRTPLRQYASCVLIDTDDSLDSIFSSDMAIGKYVAQRAGIGINAGRIRGINSRIRGGEVQHTGVVPFLKKFESTVRCCTQNGIRGGSATVHFPIWHQEIRDIIVLKNNKGTDDNRVRKLDYSIQLSKLFYERFIRNEEITLFSPHDVPGLYDSFGTESFDELYVKYEQNESIPKTKIGGQELILELLKERAETGRIYIMNIDHCNSHSSFLDKVEMSNLCQEITLPTKPLQHIDDKTGEIALCILSAVNIGKIRDVQDLEVLCDLSVRSLDELIDFQGYPVNAAEIATRARRSLGVGYIGLAHYLAKQGVKYEDPKAWKLVHDLTEGFQYYLIKASVNLAKEKGACEYSNRTKYAKGILPIDTYKKEVDEIVENDLSFDWGALREELLEHGIRNSTLSAQMPSESSSVVSNATNGIEPPRGYLSIKKSKKGPLKQIVPSYGSLKNDYTLLWDMPGNTGYINIVAVMQKFFDQAISGNWSYNPEHYENAEVPTSVMAQDLLTTYKLGWKTSYYQNTYDVKTDEIQEPAHPIGWHDNVEEVGIQGHKKLDALVDDIMNSEEEACDSCSI
jgi:ribonucleoside-diphosphate reductase alpha chain